MDHFICITVHSVTKSSGQRAREDTSEASALLPLHTAPVLSAAHTELTANCNTTSQLAQRAVQTGTNALVRAIPQQRTQVKNTRQKEKREAVQSRSRRYPQALNGHQRQHRAEKTRRERTRKQNTNDRNTQKRKYKTNGEELGEAVQSRSRRYLVVLGHMRSAGITSCTEQNRQKRESRE